MAKKDDDFSAEGCIETFLGCLIYAPVVIVILAIGVFAFWFFGSLFWEMIFG